MGILRDAFNGVVFLIRFAIFMVVVGICTLGVMYLPLAVLGIDRVDAWWKGLLCVSGVIGAILFLAYLGRDSRR